MKKLLTLVLALGMAATLSVTAFAEEDEDISDEAEVIVHDDECCEDDEHDHDDDADADTDVDADADDEDDDDDDDDNGDDGVAGDAAAQTTAATTAVVNAGSKVNAVDGNPKAGVALGFTAVLAAGAVVVAARKRK